MSGRRRATAAVSQLVGSAALAGLLGYLTTWLVFRFSGPEAYAVFAVFWSAMYFVGGALAGVQQEVARATHAADDGEQRGRWPLGLIASGMLGLVVVIAGSSPLWIATAFPSRGWWFLPPLLVGAGLYVVFIVIHGTLAGMRGWSTIAWTTAIDALVRTSLVAAGAGLGFPPVVLAWFVALPFGLTLLILLPRYRRVLGAGFRRDVPDRRLARNIVMTLLASTAMALAVNGLPFLAAVTSPGVPVVVLANVVFVLVLVRAPLILLATSLQGALIVRLRDPRGRLRILLIGTGGVLAVGVVLGLAVWGIGPALFDWIAGRPLGIGGGFIAVLVASSALIAALYITGTALIVSHRHTWNTAGWVATAFATIVSLVLPFGFETRLGLAVLAGPAIGLVLHLTVLLTGTVTRLPEPVDLELEYRDPLGE